MIAQTDVGNVLYRMIACKEGDAAYCRLHEQQRLAYYLYKRWTAAAVKLMV
jgi:hypothetical protein